MTSCQITGRMGPRIAACLWGPYKGEEFSRTPGATDVGRWDLLHTWVRALTQALVQHWGGPLRAPLEVHRNRMLISAIQIRAWITVTGNRMMKHRTRELWLGVRWSYGMDGIHFCPYACMLTLQIACYAWTNVYEIIHVLVTHELPTRHGASSFSCMYSHNRLECPGGMEGLLERTWKKPSTTFSRL